MTGKDTIRVEVAYALPHKQAILPLDVAPGTTVQEAARLSGIADKFEGIDLENATFGIFAGVVAPTQVLAEGDRVEIYRPLQADPKEVRKARAARVRERRGGSQAV
ncbi:MAG: RnfH family protein [Halioglobus sp.]|nr:RnfH family protein [Halioglobus sp.]MBP6723761.1 RnfH family protein [Halioglobus sp.]